MENLDWPDDDNGRRAKEYLLPLMRNGVERYIRNIKTKLYVLRVDDLVLPLTVNESEYNTSYACSFYDFYISYLVTELKWLNKPWVETILTMALKFTGQIFKVFKINKAVCVNNWLFSTFVYPQLSTEQITSVTEFLKQRFPHHLIVFRALNTRIYGQLLNNLLECSYERLAGRRIFIVDKTSKGNKKNLKNDRVLAGRSPYHVIDKIHVRKAEVPRLAELYDLLYLQKYSRVNQQYTSEFFELVLDSTTFKLKALKKEDTIDAVVVYAYSRDAMTVPLIGYDTTVPKETGLYRLCSNIMFSEARSLGLTLNLSAGVATFKKTRGAMADTEYYAVYYAHLSPYRRVFWRLFSSIINRYALRVMKTFDV